MVKPKKRVRKSFDKGRVYINATWNNTIVTLTDPDGNVLSWNSPGRNGFKGSRQATPYAGQVSAEKIAENAEAFGIQNVDVFVSGMGAARDQAIRGLMNKGLSINSIACLTRTPHGGCRPKKVRKI